MADALGEWLMPKRVALYAHNPYFSLHASHEWLMPLCALH
jgi:hypothetical protein